MPNQKQVVSLSAPGSFGLNTEDSPTTMPLEFAKTADNCVIDKSGRLAARKGLELTTLSATPLGSSDGIESIIYHTTDTGDVDVFSSGNFKLFKGDTTLTDVSGALSITDDNWKFESWDDELWAFQKSHAAARYDNGGTNVFVTVSGAPAANEVLGAFGRLWAADVASNQSTVYWSSLLDGTDWAAGDSGSIDLTNVWPAGYDEIVGLSAFNNLLVIFGKRSIVIYSGAEDPSTMALYDTIVNVGLIDRDAKVDIGNELLFLSHDGLRGLGRVLSDQGSSPLSQVAKQIRTDLQQQIDNTTTGVVKMTFSRDYSFVICIFVGEGVAYVFDTRKQLPSGDYRATRWVNVDLLCACERIDDTLYLGGSQGIMGYNGYQDLGSDYDMVYYSNPSDLGAPDRNKILKKLEPAIVGNQATDVVMKWGYGYGSSYSSAVVSLSTGAPALYGVALYNNGEFYTGGVVINEPSIHTNGAGDTVSVGVEAVINGNELSLQRINMHLMMGRIL